MTEEMAEIWKDIPGFPGYKASDKGRVASYKKRTGTEWAVGPKWEIVEEQQRLLKPSTTPRGYEGVNLRADGKTHFMKVSYLVLLAFVGSRPDGMQVCHNDGNKKNDGLDNLRYDTAIGNVNDKCKLGEEEITSIRWMVDECEHVNIISLAAKKYGVTNDFIRSVYKGEVFKSFGSGPTGSVKSLRLRMYKKARALLDSGMNQSTVADKMGVHKSTVSRWVNGTRTRHIFGTKE